MAVDDDRGISVSPVEHDFGFFGFHIDATMGHRNAKIVMPIGPMDTETEFLFGLVVIEKQNVGNIG